MSGSSVFQHILPSDRCANYYVFLSEPQFSNFTNETALIQAKLNWPLNETGVENIMGEDYLPLYLGLNGLSLVLVIITLVMLSITLRIGCREEKFKTAVLIAFYTIGYVSVLASLGFIFFFTYSAFYLN